MALDASLSWLREVKVSSPLDFLFQPESPLKTTSKVTTMLLCGLSAYGLWYYLCAVKKPRVVHSGKPLLRRLIKDCPGLSDYYYPLFLPFSICQLIWSVGSHKLQRRLFGHSFRIKFQREMVTLSDGQTVPLDWKYPNNNNQTPMMMISDETVIIALIYGIAGNKSGFNEQRTAKYFTSMDEHDYAVVIVHRRGHDNEAPMEKGAMQLIGGNPDIAECLTHIHEKHPRNRIVLEGFSAGTGNVVRLLGDFGLMFEKDINCDCSTVNAIEISEQDSSHSSSSLIPERLKVSDIRPIMMEHYGLNNEESDKYQRMKSMYECSLICGCMVCPGYDLRRVFDRMQQSKESSLIISLVKQRYLKEQRHYLNMKSENDLIFNDLVSQFENASHIHDINRIIVSMDEKYSDYNEYLIRNNPVINLEFIRKPILVFNSRDDPLCVFENVQDWMHMYQDPQSDGSLSVLVDTDYGTHCVWAELNPFSVWFDRIIHQFIQACLNL